MSFSTINESDLHKTIKLLYSENFNGKTEVSIHNHIYDILTDDNTAIEIQTKNLTKLLPKILDSLDKGLKIKLVHTVINNKTIETYKDGLLISKRKSPKKETLYAIFSEITGLYLVLLNPNFSLDILIIDAIEIREKLDTKVQSKNNKRRFKKDWNKTNKKLDQIISKKTFSTKQDYLNLLPNNLPMEFSSKELKECFVENDNFPKEAYAKVNLILWVFNKMGLIELTEIKNKRKYYKFVN